MLSPTHRVIRFDLPGFGLTGPMPHRDYAMAHYVAVVTALLDSLHVQRVILGGNSFGGQVAVMVARAQPDRIAKLILWGRRDHLIPPENAERFHRDIAGSTLVIFDGLGHVPHEEDPARTVAAVQRFLGH